MLMGMSNVLDAANNILVNNITDPEIATLFNIIDNYVKVIKQTGGFMLSNKWEKILHEH